MTPQVVCTCSQNLISTVALKAVIKVSIYLVRSNYPLQLKHMLLIMDVSMRYNVLTGNLSNASICHFMP